MTCRSQAYDGAGNKSGKWKGAAAVFRSETGNESAGYLHCVSHEFNLCLSKVPQVFNMVSTMQALGIFFKYSPKRQRKLKQAIAELDKEGYLKKKVKSLCKTRWVERHTAFDNLNQLCRPLLNCLELIQSYSDPNNRFNAKSTTEAAGLLKQLQNCPSSSHSIHVITGLFLRKNFVNSSKGQQLRLQKPTKWYLS